MRYAKLAVRMEMKLKISALINTRNEEVNIKYCLESLRWCDEIIVVDMESDDNTVNIAKKYTDSVFSHEKLVAFDAARKLAVEKSTGDWLLIVDADELVPVTLAQTLTNIALKDLADIAVIPHKTYMLGAWIRHTGWWPEYHPRFFKRQAMRLVGDVHAFMQEDPNARKLILPAEEPLAIQHFAYHDSAHFIEKLNRYTTIEAVQAFEKGKRFSLLRMLGVGFRGFQVRYLSQKGYKDGYRGFFLSLMMGLYRALVYVKLWEHEEKQRGGFLDYDSVKREIIEEHRQAGA